MTAQWYYAIDGRVAGPVTSDDLKQRVSCCEIAATDLVWRDGMAEWESAESLGLVTPVAPPPLPGHTLNNAERHGSRSVAAPSTAHPVTPPPPIEPPRLATLQSAAPRIEGARELRERDAREGHRPAGPSWAFRTAGLAIGALAILAGGFWIGHVVANKSHDDSDARVAAATVPNSTDKQQGPNRHTTTGSVDPVESNPTPNSAIENPPDSTASPMSRPERDTAGADTVPGSDLVSDTDPGPSSDPVPDLFPDAFPTADPITGPPAGGANPATLIDPPRSRVVVPVSEPASPRPTNTEPWRDQGSQVLFQTVEIHRRPTFVIVLTGMTIPQEFRYRIVSKLEITARAEDGTRKVVQTVERTFLDQADELSAAMFAKSLKDLQRQQFTFTLNQRNEVVKFTGHKSRAFSVPVKLTALSGFQLTSVIDEDGWKELAQFTFFEPDDSVAQGQPYKRQMTHDFSPFGAWYGTTSFFGGDVRGDLQLIKFLHKLEFTPPDAKAAAGPTGIRVVSAKFTIDQAHGTLEYDRTLRHVSMARETFHVQGSVTVKMGTRDVEIQLKEQQQMSIRITDQRPDLN